MGSFHIALLVCLCLVIWRFLYQKHICITLFGAMGCIWCFPVSKLMLGKKIFNKSIWWQEKYWVPLYCLVKPALSLGHHLMVIGAGCLQLKKLEHMKCLVPRNVSGAKEDVWCQGMYLVPIKCLVQPTAL